MQTKREPLCSMWVARQRYGFKELMRPQYVAEGHCQNCGNPLTGRKTSFCSKECSRDFNRWVTWNRGRNAYSTHILRRDDFTCQQCGEFLGGKNKHGIRLPVSNGRAEVHHKIPVSEGGSDAPDNLITLCTDCHLEAHGKTRKDVAH